MIGERVHSIMYRRRVRQTQMSARMGISQGALSKKLHGDRPWTPEDVYMAAYLLKVPVSEILPTLDEVLPHLDSNQEPFDYRLHAALHPSAA